MQMKHWTKKYAALSVLSLGIAMVAPGISQAAISASLGRSTYTAVAQLTGTGSISFNAAIREVGTNAPAAQISWTGVTLPAGLVRASHYIQLASTFTASNGGIEIYTDNTAADATPYQYTGVISSNTPPPSGLVDGTSHTNRLPMTWTIQASTVAPTPQNPNVPATGFAWFFMTDRGQVAVPSQNVTAFEDGLPYITVANNQCGTPANPGNTCIHYAQGAGGQGDPTQFGGAPSPNNIFLAADFSTAVTPRTYGTSTLRLEAYTQ
jgi:hypothetical protein